MNIQENIKGYGEAIVEDEDTAVKLGSGNLAVFATPAMVALMENTAMSSVIDGLEKGFDTVGIEINVKHIRATPKGAKVWCESVLTKIEEKRLFFEVNAFDEKGTIGTATHVRYIIDVNKFLDRL